MPWPRTCGQSVDDRETPAGHDNNPIVASQLSTVAPYFPKAAQIVSSISSRMTVHPILGDQFCLSVTPYEVDNFLAPDLPCCVAQPGLLDHRSDVRRSRQRTACQFPP